MSWFDQFKKKYDSSMHPSVSAAAYFAKEIAPWQQHDEFRLSLLKTYEGNIGWGSINSLGLIHATDGRALASFSVAGGINYGSEHFQMLVSTSFENFSYVIQGTGEKTAVYYSGQYIGWINELFNAFDTNNQLVLIAKTETMPMLQQGPITNSVSPTRFSSHLGMKGWFNVPPHPHYYPRLGMLQQSRGIVPSVDRLPTPYERMWMLAVFFFLTAGPHSQAIYDPHNADRVWEDFVDDVLFPYV